MKEVNVGGEGSAVQGAHGRERKERQFEGKFVSGTSFTGIPARSDSEVSDEGLLAESRTTSSVSSHPPRNSSALGRFGILMNWVATWTLNKFVPPDPLLQTLTTAIDINTFTKPKGPRQISEDISLDTSADSKRVRRIWGDGIVQAFDSEIRATDDKINPGTTIKAKFARIRHSLMGMTLGRAREAWQRIANVVAADCLDPDGHVNVGKLGEWKIFFESADTFRNEPYRLAPLVELMRSQMHRVCECLLDNQNGARDQLDAAADIPLGSIGQSILDAMSLGRQPPLRSGEAILASLFTPHRQLSLPTCAIHSLINEEIRNHLERLIKMYIQMLSGDQFNFPSGYAVQQQQMMDGFITIDLKNGGMGRNDVFEDITDGDPAKAAEQIEEWKKEGIEYVESTNLAEKYKLRLPVHNMNDILFAHLLRVSNFGNSKMSLDSEFCTTLIYAGHMNHWETYTLEIQVDRSNFLAVIEESKRRARAQQQLGYRYMRMFTVESKTVESNNDAHIENLDIDALLDLNPDTMETNRAYPIGDRNWAAQSMLQDIPRLAVRKVDGTPPAYEFGTLRGSTFDKTNISKILFFNTKIERFDSRGFLSLFWGILCRLYWDFRCRFFP